LKLEKDSGNGSGSAARKARKAATPKTSKVTLRKPAKQINCKTCGKSCLAGKRGLCDRHWAEEQKAKAIKVRKEEKVRERRAKKVQKRRESLPVKKKKVELIFSKFIRLRDTDEMGRGYCIDCGAPLEWGKGQCGHFRRRGLMPTTFDERNCNLQWSKCNGPVGKGREYEHGLAIDEKYGVGTAKELYITSLGEAHFTAEDYDKMLEHYTKKVNDLIKTKHFTPWQK
jgi:ferredoxin